MLGGTGPDTSEERSEVDWLDGKIRSRVNLIFNTYLMDKSASELVALAERVEQEETGPGDRKKVNCSNCGCESSSQHRFCTHCGTELKPVEVMTAASAGGATGWMAPVPDYGDWDWDPGSGGGDWSA